MDLVIIFGPPAVGKMTVGRELARMTGLRLFHNHMALEPALEVFPYGSEPFNRLVRDTREAVFQEVAHSNMPGLVYTCMWNLTAEDAKAGVDDVCALFRKNGARVSFVELYAPLDVRIQRNETELRLREKPSKRDVAASEQRLREREHDSTLNTTGQFFYPESYIRIDNSNLQPERVAEMIIDRFNLESAM